VQLVRAVDGLDVMMARPERMWILITERVIISFLLPVVFSKRNRDHFLLASIEF